ncbi:MAG: transposase [Bacteroidota bacterium]
MSALRIHKPYEAYFMTFTTVGWVDIFSRKACKDILLESLAYCQEHKGLIVYAYVIMSNHVHLIAQAKAPTRLGDIMRDYKKYTSKALVQFLKTNKESRRNWMYPLLKSYANKTPGKKNIAVWQAGNHPKELYSPPFIEQKLNYVHINPVRAGYVVRAEHYVYSSASNYVLGRGILDVNIIEPMSGIGFVGI